MLHSVLVRQASCHSGVTPPAPVQNKHYRTLAILVFFGVRRPAIDGPLELSIEEERRFEDRLSTAISEPRRRFNKPRFSENKTRIAA